MLRLRGYGLRLTSQLAIPGAVPDPDAAVPDVVITCAPPESGTGERGLRRTDTGIVFLCLGVARYTISSETIAVTPEPGVPIDTVSAMLVATALPALLWLRGRLVLHAAAARMPGAERAIAIAGASGSGKSTILAQLAASGADLIGDDSIAFDPERSGASASGLAGGWFSMAPDWTRDFVNVAPDRALAGAQIAAMFILDPVRARRPEFTRLAPIDAVAALLAHRHRARVPALLGQAERSLRDATLLAAAIPLYNWRRGDGAVALSDAELAMLISPGERDEMTEAKWVRDEAWVGSAIEDSFVMVNIDTGSYVALNSTAQAIWDALETSSTAAEIEARLVGQFDVAADVCAAAVARTLAEMETQQLARVV